MEVSSSACAVFRGRYKSSNIMDPEQGVAVVSKNTFLKRKRRKLPKTVLKEQFHEFGAVTTLHGLRYVTDRRLSIFEKVFWLVIFSISVGFCIYRINAVWTKWQESPVLVTVNEHLVPVGSVPFPSMTICPQKKTMASIFNYTAVQQYALKYNSSHKNISMEKLRLYEDLMLICRDPLSEFYDNEGNIPRNNSSPSIIENLLKVAPGIDDVLDSCVWHNKYVECSDFFKTVLTAEGVCFTINSIRAQEMFSKENMWSEYNYSNITLNETSRGWSTNGYYDPNEKDPYPRRGQGNGERNELQILFMEKKTDQDQVCNNLYDGFKVYIEHPYNVPGSSTHYYTVTPNKETALALKFNILSTAEKLRYVSSGIRQCYFPNDYPLRYFNIYTANNCIMECLANITYERCNCVAFYMPRENNTEVCTYMDMECMRSAKEEFGERLTKYSYIHTELDDNNEICNCLPSCNSVDYDADIVRSDYNFKTYLRGMRSHKGYEYIDDLIKGYTYSLMRVYYKQPRYVSMSRSELFGITDFLANCGGLLGLFMGFSFLSLVEIIYFMTLRLWCTIKRKTKEEKTM